MGDGQLRDVIHWLDVDDAARIAFRVELGLELVAPFEHESARPIDLDHFSGVGHAASANTSRQVEPACHSDSWCMPNQYCLVNAALVSAVHSCSCVVRI